MAVLHFFLLNSTLIYILFSLLKSLKSLKYLHHGVNTENDRTKVLGCNTDLDRLYDRKRERHSPEYSAGRTNSVIHSFIHSFSTEVETFIERVNHTASELHKSSVEIFDFLSSVIL